MLSPPFRDFVHLFASTFSFKILFISTSFSHHCHNYYCSNDFHFHISVTIISLLISKPSLMLLFLISIHFFLGFGHGTCATGRPVRKKWLHDIDLSLLGSAQISLSNSEKVTFTPDNHRVFSLLPFIANRLPTAAPSLLTSFLSVPSSWRTRSRHPVVTTANLPATKVNKINNFLFKTMQPLCLYNRLLNSK